MAYRRTSRQPESLAPEIDPAIHEAAMQLAASTVANVKSRAEGLAQSIGARSGAVAVAIVDQLLDYLALHGQSLVDDYLEERRGEGASDRIAVAEIGEVAKFSRTGVRVMFGRQSRALQDLKLRLRS